MEPLRQRAWERMREMLALVESLACRRGRCLGKAAAAPCWQRDRAPSKAPSRTVSRALPEWTSDRIAYGRGRFGNPGREDDSRNTGSILVEREAMLIMVIRRSRIVWGDRGRGHRVVEEATVFVPRNDEQAVRPDR